MRCQVSSTGLMISTELTSYSVVVAIRCFERCIRVRGWDCQEQNQGQALSSRYRHFGKTRSPNPGHIHRSTKGSELS